MKERARASSIPAVFLALLIQCAPDQQPSQQAQDVARYAVSTYADSMESMLAQLVAFRTVDQAGVPTAENPEFRAMTAYLAQVAQEYGFDFADHGAVVVIGLGDADDRLGIVTHGDVQPADATKWALDPFLLDAVSEPGLLLGRGVEDDKGPIATALYAMKALSDQGVTLARRIELVVSYTEESSWTPFQEFLAEWDAPDLNVALDAEYPVVTAEKGWNAIFLSFAPDSLESGPGPRLVSFRGGAFLSQIPEDAEAVIVGATPALHAALMEAGDQDTLVRFDFRTAGDSLVAQARGMAAHSSKPREGRNAITHLAAVLGTQRWPSTQVSRMVEIVNDLVGTGDYAEQFGDLAYSHEFMGPLTLSLTTLGVQEDGSLMAGINVRRPVGRTGDEIERAIQEAVNEWKNRTGVEVQVSTILGDPHYLDDAPHIPALLSVYRHYTGNDGAEPISIGGGTHARLVPSGVNFGPAMPGEPYTGHSEHEYMTRDQMRLNLEMYTAMLVELAGQR